MPLFSDTIEHGSTSVDAKPVEFTAHGRDRGFATILCFLLTFIRFYDILVILKQTNGKDVLCINASLRFSLNCMKKTMLI